MAAATTACSSVAKVSESSGNSISDVTIKSKRKRRQHSSVKAAAEAANLFPRWPEQKRSKAVRPTLKELQSTKFSTYVQRVLFDWDEENGGEGEVDEKQELLGESDKQNGKVSMHDSAATSTQSGNNQQNFSNRRRKRPGKKQISWHHGVIKVTLPPGWWDQGGIANDTTARGPQWQRGTRLGDLEIPSPIKQRVDGIGGIYEFTLLESPALSLVDYRDKADAYMKRQLGAKTLEQAMAWKHRSSSTPDNHSDDNNDDANDINNNAANDDGDDDDNFYSSDHVCDELVRKFWRRMGPTMAPAMYGADMEGSLFQGNEANGWSLEQLDNCLRLLDTVAPTPATKTMSSETQQEASNNGNGINSDDKNNINNKNKKNVKKKKKLKSTRMGEGGSGGVPGVTTPYLYFGMWGSVFCAHTEDMNLLSINYLHSGAPKYWYAIAPDHAKLFESLAESLFAHARQDCPEFLRHKRHLISPAILRKNGIPFTTQIQRPGDAILTCPGAYHFGVNLGFNVAEATNFAIPQWITKGKEAKICMCRPHSVRIDMQRFERLLERYQQDARNVTELGLSATLSYKDWTRLEARRATQRQETLVQQQQQQITNQNTVAAARASAFVEGGKFFCLSTTSSAYLEKGKEFWVEVVAMSTLTGGNRKRNKRKRKANDSEEWRLAKPLEKHHVKMNAPVLCLLTGKTKQPTEGRDDEQCFAGRIVEIADGHCRVHFAGMRKEDDVWMPVDSPKLFADGGKYVEPKATPTTSNPDVTVSGGNATTAAPMEKIQRRHA